MAGTFREKFIGDRAFYRRLLTLVLPLMIQQGITSFVNLLDNVMVGGLGTESIGAVAIVNQILMVFNLAMFGGLAGASIFGAQFFGKGDMDGVRHTFRYRIILGSILTAAAFILLRGFGETFISGFLTDSGDGGDLILTMQYAKTYLGVMFWGLVPFMIVQVYAGNLRESGETVIPMIGSVSAILVNLTLNWILIFGHLGAPALGVKGAAVATVISRFVEFLIVAGYASAHTDRFPFLKGAFSSLRVPKELTMRILKLGWPLFLNELLWSMGMTFINQCYSTRGLSSVAAVNIMATISNLFAVVMMASGSAISIMVGQKLGSGDRKGARELDTKLLFTTFAAHIVIAAVLFSVSGLIPLMYNVDDTVRQTAAGLLRIEALSYPMMSLIHGTYFTIRSGGKTFITFLFDSCYTWAVPCVMAWCLAHLTGMDVLMMNLCLRSADLVKLIIGLLMLKSDFWANDIVS